MERRGSDRAAARYFAPKSSSQGLVYGSDDGYTLWNGPQKSTHGSNQDDHDDMSPIRSVAQVNGLKSQSYGPTTSSAGLIPTMQKWKTSSSSRRTDTSSDELAASLDNDADDFVKMDARLQMKVLCCRSPDEKVRVYKEYVCELLHELVMTETHSEELEYELGLKSETIEQLQHKIESLMAPEAFQTLREFEDSAEFDKPYDSQGELRALCRKQEAEVHILLERVNAAEEREAALRHQVAAKDDELAQLSVAHRQLQTDLRNENKRREESDKKTSVLREKLDALRRSSQHPSIQASLDEALSKAAHFREVAEARQREIEEYAAKINELNRQVVSHADALQTSESLYQAALQRHEVDVQRVHASYRDELDVLSSKFKQCDLVRRKLHNQVMELKGNIRVFCRIRPHLVSERSSGRPLSEVGLNVYMFPDYDKDKRRVVLVGDAKAHTSYAQQLNSSSHNDTKKWSFEFDQVFNWHATQHEMFEEVAALIQSAVDGYNVSIFAYGQTGSGKTYTMQGDEVALAEHTPSQWNRIPDLGIVGRTMSHLFATCASQKDHGWEYTITFEMYEIYNETIRDLMVNPSSPPQDITTQLDADGRVHVTNLTVLEVRDEVHAMQLLKQATTRRSVKKTNRNDVSSRSHCITTLKLTGRHQKSNSMRKGAVYLVDLAGSERLKCSGSGSDPVMLKEAQNINKSLASLGNVISAIATKKPHVPFRDTKLTYVLQNTLGHDSKTLMICTLSPLEEHREESLNTLRFAKKVNACELAVAAAAK